MDNKTFFVPSGSKKPLVVFRAFLKSAIEKVCAGQSFENLKTSIYFQKEEKATCGHILELSIERCTTFGKVVLKTDFLEYMALEDEFKNPGEGDVILQQSEIKTRRLNRKFIVSTPYEEKQANDTWVSIRNAFRLYRQKTII